MSFSSHTGDELVLDRQKQKLKPPRKYQVVLLNDDFTPMDFVVDLLKRFFSFDELKATQIMLEIHHRGRGVCGVFSREIAETKAFQVNSHARANGFPLMCEIEAV